MTTLADRDRARSKQDLNSERIKDTEKSVNTDTDYGHKPEDDGDSGRHDLKHRVVRRSSQLTNIPHSRHPIARKKNKKQTRQTTQLHNSMYNVRTTSLTWRKGEVGKKWWQWRYVGKRTP